MPDREPFERTNQPDHLVASCPTSATTPSRCVAFAFAAAAVLAVAGCGPRDDRYDPSPFAFGAAIAPAGVVVPAEAAKGPGEYRGVYLADPLALSCCLIAPHAIVAVTKRRGDAAFVAGFWIPDVASLRGGQRLVLSFPGGQRERTPILLPGEQRTVRVALSPRTRSLSGTVPVRIDAEVDYVPSRAGDSGDTRHFGGVMTYAYFE